MTWHGCSPPWPARESQVSWPQVSWPERRQRWLPSCDWPLRPASRPRPAGRCGATAGPAAAPPLALLPGRAGRGHGRRRGHAGRPGGLRRRAAHGLPAVCPRRGRGAAAPARQPGAVPGGAIIAGRSRSRSWPARPASRPRSRTSRPDPPRRPASRERPGPGRRRRRDPFPVPPARAACRARGRPSSPGRGCPPIPPRRPGGRRYAAAPVRSARPGPCPAWSPTSLDRDRASLDHDRGAAGDRAHWTSCGKPPDTYLSLT